MTQEEKNNKKYKPDSLLAGYVVIDPSRCITEHREVPEFPSFPKTKWYKKFFNAIKEGTSIFLFLFIIWTLAVGVLAILMYVSVFWGIAALFAFILIGGTISHCWH